MLCFEDCNIVSNIIKFCNDCLENPNSLQKKIYTRCSNIHTCRLRHLKINNAKNLLLFKFPGLKKVLKTY